MKYSKLKFEPVPDKKWTEVAKITFKNGYQCKVTKKNNGAKFEVELSDRSDMYLEGEHFDNKTDLETYLTEKQEECALMEEFENGDFEDAWDQD